MNAKQNEFLRESRYLVFKRKDLGAVTAVGGLVTWGLF